MTRHLPGLRLLDPSARSALLGAVLVAGVPLLGSLRAADCNLNGTEDAAEIRAGTSPDCDTNGVPDECDVREGIDFLLRRTLSVGQAPLALVAADLDGDAILDLAATRHDRSELWVRLGEGRARYAPRVIYETGGEGATALAAGDIDGDGDLDLAVANGLSGQLSLLENRGDGTLALTAVANTGIAPASVSLADLDRDGHLDAVTANAGSANLTVLLNDGQGHLGIPAVAARDLTAVSVRAADLDGDSFPDLAVALLEAPDDDKVAVLWSRGRGRFRDPQRLRVGRGPRDAIASDLDGDGDLDLAAANSEFDSLSVLWNEGGRAFAAGPELPAGRRPLVLAAGDLDGNGSPDLAAADFEGGTVSVLLGAGGGVFGRARHLAAGEGPRSVAAADLDGDGRLDLAVVNALSEDLTLFLAQAVPAASEDCNRNGIPDPCDIAAGASDADGDGVPDECDPLGTPHRRGDANADGSLNISDAAFLLSHLFRSGEEPPCVKAADADDSGDLALTDAVFVLNHLFRGGASPPEPFSACGRDPTEDGLGCMSFPPCP